MLCNFHAKEYTCLVVSVYISQRSVCQLYVARQCPFPFTVHMATKSVWSVVLCVTAVSVLVYCWNVHSCTWHEKARFSQ